MKLVFKLCKFVMMNYFDIFRIIEECVLVYYNGKKW